MSWLRQLASRGPGTLRGGLAIQRCDVPAGGFPSLATRAVSHGQPHGRRPVHEHLRPAVDAQRRTDGIGWLPGPSPGSNTGGRTDRRVRQSSRRFPRRIASGEGAHGPDRSRLAMCCQGRTSRQRKAIRRPPAPSTPCLPRKDDRQHAQGSHLLYTRRARQALPCVTRTSSISDAAYRVGRWGVEIAAAFAGDPRAQELACCSGVDTGGSADAVPGPSTAGGAADAGSCAFIRARSSSTSWPAVRASS